jgi:hypothetical protein
MLNFLENSYREILKILTIFIGFGMRFGGGGFFGRSCFGTYAVRTLTNNVAGNSYNRRSIFFA